MRCPETTGSFRSCTRHACKRIVRGFHASTSVYTANTMPVSSVGASRLATDDVVNFKAPTHFLHGPARPAPPAGVDLLRRPRHVHRIDLTDEIVKGKTDKIRRRHVEKGMHGPYELLGKAGLLVRRWRLKFRQPQERGLVSPTPESFLS